MIFPSVCRSRLTAASLTRWSGARISFLTLCRSSVALAVWANAGAGQKMNEAVANVTHRRSFMKRSPSRSVLIVTPALRVLKYSISACAAIATGAGDTIDSAHNARAWQRAIARRDYAIAAQRSVADRGDDDCIFCRPQLCGDDDCRRKNCYGQELASRAWLVVAGNPPQCGASRRGLAGRRRLERLDGQAQALVSRPPGSSRRGTAGLLCDYIHLLLVAPLATRIGLSVALDSSGAPQSAAHRGHHQFLQAPV